MSIESRRRPENSKNLIIEKNQKLETETKTKRNKTNSFDENESK